MRKKLKQFALIAVCLIFTGFVSGLLLACEPPLPPKVISVSVSPAQSVLTSAGQSVVLTAAVEVRHGAEQGVGWHILGQGEGWYLPENRVVSIHVDGNSITVTAVANGTVTITAYSFFDDTKYDDVSVTVEIEEEIE